MNWLDKLERKFGRYAIKGLMNYIIGFTMVAFILIRFNIEFYQILMLIPQKVLAGEIWRLFTYIFIPQSLDMLWIVFSLYLYYLIGNALEQEWGSFKFNAYYFLGMLGTTAAAFLTGSGATSWYMNLSLFLAFARIYPDFEFLLFFVIPVKVKYLALLDWLYILFSIVTGSSLDRISAIVALINFFVFFGKDMVKAGSHTRTVHKRRQQFKVIMPKEFTYHRCTTCGRTEKDDAKLEFRYCPDCDGDYEYCMEHVRAHEHIKHTHLN